MGWCVSRSRTSGSPRVKGAGAFQQIAKDVALAFDVPAQPRGGGRATQHRRHDARGSGAVPGGAQAGLSAVARSDRVRQDRRDHSGSLYQVTPGLCWRSVGACDGVVLVSLAARLRVQACSCLALSSHTVTVVCGWLRRVVWYSLWRARRIRSHRPGTGPWVRSIRGWRSVSSRMTARVVCCCRVFVAGMG